MKLRKIIVLLFLLEICGYSFSQNDLKNLTIDELIDLKASIEKELFSRQLGMSRSVEIPIAGAPVLSEEYTVTREVLDWYTSVGAIRTKTSEANPALVTVEVVFGYKKDDKATATEIRQRVVELRDFLHRYFTLKTSDELAPLNEENLKVEIRNSINDNILSSAKIKEVRFIKLDVIKL